MVSLKKAILYGFLIWLIVFLVAFALFPIRESWRALFESIMPVVVALSTVWFALRYFRLVEGGFLREGLRLGTLWFSMSVLIDLPLMLNGPMQMSLVEYAGDIGLTYLLIPIVTTGIGVARGQNAPGQG